MRLLETFYYYRSLKWRSKSYNSSSDPNDDGWDNGGFDTISLTGIAKNIVTVGAITDVVRDEDGNFVSGGAMTGFSSWGPADDG